MHVAAQSVYTAEKCTRAIDLQHNRASLLVCVRDMEIYWGCRLLPCERAACGDDAKARDVQHATGACWRVSVRHGGGHRAERCTLKMPHAVTGLPRVSVSRDGVDVAGVPRSLQWGVVSLSIALVHPGPPPMRVCGGHCSTHSAFMNVR